MKKKSSWNIQNTDVGSGDLYGNIKQKLQCVRKSIKQFDRWFIKGTGREKMANTKLWQTRQYVGVHCDRLCGSDSLCV